LQLNAELYKNFHFFGEMDLNLFQKPKDVYEQACSISEDCGYLTTVEQIKKTGNKEIDDLKIGHIDMQGEDCDDRIIVTNCIYFDKNGITALQKCVYKTEWFNKYEGQDVEPKSESKQILTQVIEWIAGEWKEIFNLRKHEDDLKKYAPYQQALYREGKIDHKLYTGYGVEKRE